MTKENVYQKWPSWIPPFLVKAGQFFVHHSDLCTTMPYSFCTNGLIYNSPTLGPSLYGEPTVYSNIYQLMNINISSTNMSNKISRAGKSIACWPFTYCLKKSLSFLQEEKKMFKKKSLLFLQIKNKILDPKNNFFLCHVLLFTRRKNIFLNHSNKRYFIGTKKPPYSCDDSRHKNENILQRK